MIDFSFLAKSLFNGLLTLLKSLSFLLVPIIIAFIVFILSCIYFYIKHRFIEGIKPIVSDIKLEKKKNIFQTLFIDFPKQLTYDILNRDPYAFCEYGIHMVTGEQGSGKTMTVVYLLQEWAKRYLKMKVYTNMAYKYEDGPLDHWKELIERNNDKYGVVNVIDEIKTWWSNKESKDVPTEMLAEICQQRKQKKALIGTVQVFSELAKPFRSQTHFIYVPKTILGCLTFVRISKAKYYDETTDSFRRYCGFFIFAHTKKLREAYDTYKKIEKYKDMEFGNSSAFSSGTTSSQTCE